MIKKPPETSPTFRQTPNSATTRCQGPINNKLQSQTPLNSYLPLDEFPPFLLSCSASKTSRATVRDVMLKSTFSQEHISMLRPRREASAGRVQLTVSPFLRLPPNTDPTSEGPRNDAALAYLAAHKVLFTSLHLNFKSSSAPHSFNTDFKDKDQS